MIVRAALAAGVVVILSVSSLPGARSLRFVVADLTAGTTVICQPLGAGERLTLSFTHSMYGGDVREDYLVTRGGWLRRIGVTTGNAAAAEYYAYTAPVEREGDRFRVVVPPVDFAEIVVRVDATGHHRLAIGTRSYDLLALTGDGHRARLALDRPTLWNRLTGDPC